MLGGFFFFCWSGHPLLLLPLDLECPSLPGVEVKPRWAWQGAGLGCRSFWQAFGAPTFCAFRFSLLLESCTGGAAEVLPTGAVATKPRPCSRADGAGGMEVGKGLKMTQELPPEPHQPHLGVIFLPLGTPKAAWLPQLRSAALVPEVGDVVLDLLPSPSWGLWRGDSSGRGPLTATKTSPEKRQKPQFHFPSRFLSAQPVGSQAMGLWGWQGVPSAGSALVRVPKSRDTSWYLLPGWRMEMLTLLDAFSNGKKNVFWG